MEGDDNVVQFPSTPARRFRVAKNKLSDYLFGAPEGPTDDEPMHSPGPMHPGNKGLEKKQNINLGDSDSFWSQEPPIRRRQDHFEEGTEEATIHHINEGHQARYRKTGFYPTPKIDWYNQEEDPEK